MAPPSTHAASFPRASPERVAEISEALDDIRRRVDHASAARSHTPTSNARGAQTPPLLVAVSKYKPASDILACYAHGQRDFGENYVQELADKAPELPQDIRWHFIGTLQSNKSKLLASIPNLYAVQTLTSIKAADALNRALPAERASTPLNVFLQVNTSGEAAKSGLPPLDGVDVAAGAESELPAAGSGDLHALARHVVDACARLHLLGLMTIGSLGESRGAGDAPNRDFECLRGTRDTLEQILRRESEERADGVGRWGEGGRLLLSMGMSGDFEAALHGGSNVVRVGTGIFGSR